MFPSIRWASTRELCKTARRKQIGQVKQSYTLDRCVLSHTEFRGKASLFPLKYLSNAHTALCWNCNRTNTNKALLCQTENQNFLFVSCMLFHNLLLAPCAKIGRIAVLPTLPVNIPPREELSNALAHTNCQILNTTSVLKFHTC